MISVDLGADLIHIYGDLVGMVKTSMKVQQWCCSGNEDLGGAVVMASMLSQQ